MSVRDIVQEFVQPAYTQDGGVGVALFDGQGKQQFVIPTQTEEEAVRLAERLRSLFGQAAEKVGEEGKWLLRRVIGEAYFVLSGGDDEHDRCPGCGCAGYGMLRDALHAAEKWLGDRKEEPNQNSFWQPTLVEYRRRLGLR